jgi:hypothetical protein
MMDITHAESAYAQGTTSFDLWFARQEEVWNRPLIRTQLAVFMASLSPEQKIQFAPQIALLEEKIGTKEKEYAPSEIQWQPQEEGVQPLRESWTGPKIGTPVPGPTAPGAPEIGP